MTDPGTADDADRAEQQALVEPAAPVSAGEVGGIGDGVPEADALEQQLATSPGTAGTPRGVGDRDADEADVLEQEADVPLDDDERTD
ncbi:hypothetical protein SAMN05660464_0972 [Geodermatophilus dictyosporus]|uniref:Uncharacterized protein n=1 Tax=Geodermatophilus dictyosporus TaxID=1523247 RepID=A0A1I5JR69_9ACTN|nr:hypothetical protein [Geodermatophilus dictyosporus]SFO75334.1 hypothetical protein SAMN05660464_0972 [Geodermatophilus dictyosporus]